MKTKLQNLLIQDEGLKLNPYICTASKLTIGVGHNIDDNGISEETAMFILDEDLKQAINDLRTIFSFKIDTDSPRHCALISLMFNIGLTRFKKFNKMILAAKLGDWDHAADELKASKWYTQVGNRGPKLTLMLKTDKWI